MSSLVLYLAFDDTDIKGAPIGTGRLMRNFCYGLPERFKLKGVLRHQLPKFEDIPFTSNNSSACAILEIGEAGAGDGAEGWLADHARAYLLENFIEGSDPGLCIADAATVGPDWVDYGVRASGRRMTQRDAMEAARGHLLEGLGGTNDGIIGAAAAIGLTRFGWCGRFIEYGRLRDLHEPLTIGDLAATGIRALSVDRDPAVPLPQDPVITNHWIRPALIGGEPVYLVQREGDGWRAVHGKQR